MADKEDPKNKGRKKSNRATTDSLMEGVKPASQPPAGRPPVDPGKPSAPSGSVSSVSAAQSQASTRAPFSQDRFGGIWLNRQSLEELGGGWDKNGRYKGDFMSQWRSSDAYRGSEMIRGWRSDLGLQTPSGTNGPGRSPGAGPLRELQRMQSEARSMDYQARQQAERQRADAFYELWKQRYGTQAKIARKDAIEKGKPESRSGVAANPGAMAKSVPETDVEKKARLYVEAASAANSAQAANAMDSVTKGEIPTAANARGYETRQAVGTILKTTEEVTGKKNIPSDAPVAQNLPGVTLNDRPQTVGEAAQGSVYMSAVPKEFNVPVAQASQQKKDEPAPRYTSVWGSGVYGALGGGNSELGSDGRYHRFSILTHAAYSGGATARKQHGAVGSSTKFNFGTPDDNARVIRFDNAHPSVSERKSFYAAQAKRDASMKAAMSVLADLDRMNAERKSLEPAPVSPPRAVWNAVSGEVGTVWDAISGGIGTAWDAISGGIGTARDAISGGVGTTRNVVPVQPQPQQVHGRVSPKQVVAARRNARFLDGLAAEVRSIPSYSATRNEVPMSVSSPVIPSYLPGRDPGPYQMLRENPFAGFGDLIPVQNIRKTWDLGTGGHGVSSGIRRILR